MAGSIWHLMRLLDSAATLSHQGAITRVGAIAAEGQIWWNLRVTSCAMAALATSDRVANEAALAKVLNFINRLLG